MLSHRTWLTVRQTAERLETNVKNVYRWLDEERLGGEKVMGQWRIRPEDIATFRKRFCERQEAH